MKNYGDYKEQVGCAEYWGASDIVAAETSDFSDPLRELFGFVATDNIAGRRVVAAEVETIEQSRLDV